MKTWKLTGILQRVYTYSLLAVPFLLPVFPHLTGGCLAISIIIFLAANRFQFRFSKKMLGAALACTLIYFAYGIGLFYSADQPNASNLMLLRFTMFCYPVLFFSESKLKLPSVNDAVKALVAGCLFSSIISLSDAMYHYFHSGENRFSYSLLTSLLRIHPAYLSMYMVFAVLALLLPLFKRKITRNDFVVMGIIAFLLFMIYLLSARQEMIALVLLLAALTLFLFFKRKSFVTGIFITLLIAGVAIAAAFLIPDTRMRLIQMQKEFNEPYSDTDPNSVTERKVIWQTAAELIRQSPVIGYGTGDVNDELAQHYREKNLQYLVQKNLNAHNQFLQTTLALGVVGLLCLLVLFGYSFMLAWKKKNTACVVFILLFIISILTEAMLEAEAGVVFFAFFNTLFAAECLRINQVQHSGSGDLP